MTPRLSFLLFLLFGGRKSTAFIFQPLKTSRWNDFLSTPKSSLHSIEVDSLMDMDVVIYSLKSDIDKEKIGAVQEDGTISPLSVWTDEPVFGESLEFLVDEEDRFPGLTGDDCVVHSIVPQDRLSYGSRQVGGGMGPGNPHGEESELLYYVDQKIVANIEFEVKPQLEIWW